MSSNNRAGSPRRWPGLLALAAMLAAAGAACDADRQELVSPVGDAILRFPITVDAADALPGGAHTIDLFALQAVDATRGDDPFGGQTDFFTDEASFFVGCGTEPQNDDPCPAFEFPARTGSDDPRLPALQDPDAVLQTSITPMDLFGTPWFIGTAAGLDASTAYFIALERLATVVNGEPDAVVTRLDNDEFGPFRSDPSDPPDELVRSGGSIGTTLGSNPYVLGSFTTDASGGSGGLVILQNIDGGGTDAFLTTNNPESFDLPRYNYLVVYRGDPSAGGVPVARAQFGIDLDPAGQPLVVSYAPFPTEPVGTLGDLLALDCCAGRAGTLTLELANLAQISGVYQFWLLNDVTGEVVSPAGDLTVLAPDEAGDLQELEVRQGVRSLAGNADQVYRFTTDDARAGITVGNFTHLLVSIESAEAASPSASQPIWTRFNEMDPADPADAFLWQLTAEESTVLGTFNLGEEPAVFTVGGFGDGAFTGEEFGTADVLRARFRNLPLPPVGYFYEGFLRSEGAEVSAGELTTEFAEGFRSLRDVDVDRSISSRIAPTRIIESAIRVTLEDVGTAFPVFDDFVLKLRPKASVNSGPTIIVGGAVPEGIKTREDTGEEGS